MEFRQFLTILQYFKAGSDYIEQFKKVGVCIEKSTNVFEFVTNCYNLEKERRVQYYMLLGAYKEFVDLGVISFVEIYLTRTGLFITQGNKSGFFSNNGEFRRICPDSEKEYLLSPNLPKIQFQEGIPFEVEFPQWIKLGCFRIMEDYSNYKAETSSNGGDYAFYTYKHIFARTIKGSVEFVGVDLHSTSAEFEYDELSGQFQTQLAYHSCVDAILSYKSFSNDKEEVTFFLTDVATKLSYLDIKNLQCTYHENDGTSSVSSAFFTSEWEEMNTVILKMGYTPSRYDRKSSVRR